VAGSGIMLQTGTLVGTALSLGHLIKTGYEYLFNQNEKDAEKIDAALNGPCCTIAFTSNLK